MIRSRTLLLTAVGVVLITLPFIYTIKAPAAPAPGFELLGRVLGIIESDYVEPVNEQKLMEAALSGMVGGLDPHSSYMNQQAYEEMRVETRGEYGGLGLEITQDDNVVKIISPIDDTPAARAGLKPEDVIAAIDGQMLADLPLSDVVNRLRGPVNSKVTLTIQRSGVEAFDVPLSRAEIKIASVKWQIEDGRVGYLRISSFIENTEKDLRAAMAAIADKTGSGKLVGYVLDLRNDPGGLVDEAVGVADDFLEGGEIVSIRGRDPEDVKRYDAQPGDLAHGLPVVVLINGGSASASEIVAGALRDNHRGVLLGTRSFGKGSVQTIIPLQGQGALRLTTARYYTPSGRSIQAEGITPDIEVEPARIEKLAMEPLRSEADLPRALKNTDAPKTAAQGAPAAPPADAGHNVPPGTIPANQPKPDVAAPVIGTAEDYQLARAVDLLEGITLLKRQAPDDAGAPAHSPG